jgi:hypothetical protein
MIKRFVVRMYCCQFAAEKAELSKNPQRLSLFQSRLLIFGKVEKAQLYFTTVVSYGDFKTAALTKLYTGGHYRTFNQSFFAWQNAANGCNSGAVLIPAGKVQQQVKQTEYTELSQGGF